MTGRFWGGLQTASMSYCGATYTLSSRPFAQRFWGCSLLTSLFYWKSETIPWPKEFGYNDASLSRL